jgi:hypothetical protein
VYVWVNVTPDADPNGVHPQGEVDPYRELIEELRDRVRSLEDANRENRRIIAALTQRIPELEASRESDLSASDRGPTDTPTEASDAPQTAAETPQGRSWWRRLFEG